MIAEVPVTIQWVLWLVVTAAMIVLSALYSGLETGVYVLNKMRLDLRAEAGSKPARMLRVMLRKIDAVLVTMLIGTNIANYAATFAIGAMFVLAAGGESEHAEWYAMAVATPLLFVLAESAPKSLFQKAAESLVYRLVWFLRISQLALTYCGLVPLVRAVARMVAGLTRSRQPLGHEGLAAIVAEGQASGALTHAQSIMADRIMHLTDIVVADAMKPMKDVRTAPADITRAQLDPIVKDYNYSRLPLVDRDRRVVGILDIYDILTESPDVQPAQRMTAPLLVDSRATVTDALYHMQKAHASMAVVTGAANKHIGVVTIKDLVEEIVGELEAW